MSENRISSTKKDRRLWQVILGAAAGIALLIFGGMGLGGEKAASEVRENTPDPSVYAREVEEQVTALCSQVKGAGAVSVVVTLKGGYRSVYAIDSQSTSGGYKNSTVLVGSGSSEEALMICYENPEIAGIGIVCAGGDDPVVRGNIVSLVSATLNIGSNKIYVAASRLS